MTHILFRVNAQSCLCYRHFRVTSRPISVLATLQSYPVYILQKKLYPIHFEHMAQWMHDSSLLSKILFRFNSPQSYTAQQMHESPLCVTRTHWVILRTDMTHDIIWKKHANCTSTKPLYGAILYPKRPWICSCAHVCYSGDPHKRMIGGTSSYPILAILKSLNSIYRTGKERWITNSCSPFL